jgi:P-type conjugative transfer protein TrbL
MAIDPSTISLIQTIFITHIDGAFHTIAHYAQNLLFIFAVFETIVFGLLWAFGGHAPYSDLFFKVIKITLIFFIIQNYTWLLTTIINSFAKISISVTNAHDLGELVFNPATIWKYGYDVSLGLLKLATTSSGIGLVILLVALGLGILLIFGLIGIQIVVQLIGFYLVALIALILMPLGAFNPGTNMFDKSVQAVLKAGIRVAVLIMVIGIAMAVWHSFDLTALQDLQNLQNVQGLSDNFNLNQVLGLFFTALLFLFLAIRLPRYASEAVGLISLRHTNNTEKEIVANLPLGYHAANATAGTDELSAMKAATVIDSRSAPNNSESKFSTATSISNRTPIAETRAASGAIINNSLNPDIKKDGLQSASKLDKNNTSISDSTIKKLKKTCMQAR